MHRVIAETPEGKETDHVNHNSLDNRRENLRVCTHSQNMANASKKTPHTSKFKGVTWNRHLGRWYSRITCNGKLLNIGPFNSEIDAAKAYDEKATELFGEFALPNFPQEKEVIK